MSTSPAAANKDEQSPAAGAAAPQAAKSKGSVALLNFWVDAALFVAVVFVMWISVMLQVVFPPPTAAAGWRLWGFTYDDWRNAQFFAVCVCVLIAIEHLVLHWNWVCSIIATKVLRTKSRPDEGVQAVYGVGTFVVVLLVMMGSILTAVLTIQKPR